MDATNDEILTVSDLAAILKMSKNQIFGMTSKRGQVRMEHPLPVLRINGNLRFSSKAVREWLESLKN